MNQNIDFQKAYEKIIINHPYNDYIGEELCLIQGKNRIFQPDFNGIMTEKIYYLSYDPRRIYKYHLNTLFITINRDSGFQEDIKLWPLDYYLSLIQQLKEDYPFVQLVSIGVRMHQELRNAVDVDLVGKTDMEELKALMGLAVLHISSEGFTVHLRHFVKNKPSVVFFGPTPEAFYGYEENINISPVDSNCWCEWKYKDWYKKCVKGTRCCLKESTVAKVYPLINERLIEILRTEYPIR